MRKLLLLSVLSVLTFYGGHAQSSLWREVSPQKLASAPKLERASYPTEFKFYNLNLTDLKMRLQDAPSREDMTASNVIVQFPNSKGELRTFRMYESSSMAPELAARYPEIQGYVGQGVDNPSEAVHISTTIFGLHVMMFTGNGTVYIDPFTADRNTYMVYARNGLTTDRAFECLVSDEPSEDANRIPQESSLNDDGLHRVYRLAMACTIEYAAFHVNAAGVGGGTLAQKKAAVLAAMNVTMTRVNGLYERDMSVRMNLIANNDAIIFIDSDNYTNADGAAMLDENQTVITATIGSANYDIGHVVSTGGGGIAQLNSPCNTNSKARGVTGSPAPVGDPFDIDYVAHEMGHQFGATHTQNNSCQRTLATAFETGSGVTIMGYAGICPPDVQSNSDDHFHAASIAQMSNFVLGGGSCSVNTANGNTPPVANAGPNYTIPHSTAFILKGAATDADGDSLTYCWEQMDNQVSTQPPLSTSTSGPNVTSDSPKVSPDRYIPNFASVLNGNLAPTWEVVPTVARTMNFALTVRDNNTPNGGQTHRDDTVITFAGTGPFALTAPAENVNWQGGSTQTVTWSLGGSNAAPINTANVNILISTDNGATFSMLLANTPNDGSQSVTMPSVHAQQCRIMVEAVGNIFYAVSRSFAIGYTISTTCNTYSNTNALAIPDGLAANTGGPIVSNTISVPITGVISDVNIGLDVDHTWPNDLIIRVVSPTGTAVPVWNRACAGNDNFDVTLNDGSPAFTCVANMTGTFSPSSPLAAFNGLEANGIWTLTAQDFWNADTGSVADWSITVCTTSFTMSAGEFGFEGFSVYPNPSNGSFNVKFDGASASPINVLVHDLRGRSVFTKEYASNGSFDETISLNNVQSGVYVLTVQSGERKEVKKIVVN